VVDVHGSAGTRGRAYIAAALEREADAVEHAPIGRRNHTLNASTHALARFVASGELDSTTVINTMSDAAHAAGLEGEVGPPHTGEVGPTIASAFRARGVDL
jgi:hypothetical protein